MSGYQISIDDYLASLPVKARGETCEPEDVTRLSEQCRVVYSHMRDLRAHTLREISAATNIPEASVSARIREIRAYLEGRPLKNDPPDLQRAKLGTILREKVDGVPGLHTYSMQLNRFHGAA
jgi:hypothetical protein